MSMSYQVKPIPKGYLKMNTFQFDNNNTLSLKKINDSMSQKIKQNQKQKIPIANQNGSNISSGLNTEKRNFYKINYFNEDLNSGIFQRNGSQSSLSVDLNRFKINPNTFNPKNKENNPKSNKNNKKININLNDNFDTFNPRKDKVGSINNSLKNINVNNINGNNNEIIENYSNSQNKQKNNVISLINSFDPYNVNHFIGETKSTKNKKINLVNNISPSTSNLQMILYNKKKEKQDIQEFLKENNSKNNLDNSVLTSNKNNPPFTRNDSPRSKVSEVSSKVILNEHNSFKLLNNFINNMDDESKDKIALLTFLSIPRIMNMIFSKEQKCSFVFYCSPTNISCLYGIETYIFKWNECKNYNLVGYFDLINVENCYLNNSNRKIFEIILNNNGKTNNNDEFNGTNHYCIEAEEEETAINYFNAINFISQLVKYRVYLRKKMKNPKNH